MQDGLQDNCPSLIEDIIIISVLYSNQPQYNYLLYLLVMSLNDYFMTASKTQTYFLGVGGEQGENYFILFFFLRSLISFAAHGSHCKYLH